MGLSNWGNGIQIKQTWGIGLPSFCFGAGFILYLDMIIFIFGNLYTSKHLAGSGDNLAASALGLRFFRKLFPFTNCFRSSSLSGAMYLLVAPPSVAVMSLDGLDEDGFPVSAEMLLGWVLVLFVLLLRLGPSIYKAPSVLGEYFSYIGPISATTSATVKYAPAMNTPATIGLEVIMATIAPAAILMVFMRSLTHAFLVSSGSEQWLDPIFEMEHYNSRR